MILPFPPNSAVVFTVTPETLAPSTYWAIAWDGGYLGVQTDGTGPDGQPRDQVIFSEWGSSIVAGNGCVPVYEYSPANRCTLPVSVSPGQTFSFYLFNLDGYEDVVMSPDGGNTVTLLGVLTVPGPVVPTGWFIEDFGHPGTASTATGAFVAGSFWNSNEMPI